MGRPTTVRSLQNAALLILSLVLGLLAAEIILRAATRANATPALAAFHDYMNYADRNYYLEGNPMFRRVTDPELGWEAIPGTYHHGLVRINADGFRGPDRSRAKPAGSTRLAFLGDSETFGERLSEEDSLPGQLQDELARRHARYEVLNFGIVGYNTEQEYALLRKRVMQYSPDVVVLYYVFNDPELPDRVLHFQGLRLLQGSYLCNLVQWATAGRQNRAAAVPFEGSFIAYYTKLHESVYFDRARTLITEMGAYCAARNIPFVVAIAPEVFEVRDLGRGYPYADIHSKLRALASPTVEVVDPLPALATIWNPADPKALWVGKFDPHKNARANAVIARVLADALLPVHAATR